MRTVAVTVLVGAAMAVSQPLELSGTVINQAGRPVPGLAVTLPGPGLTDSTDDNGEFRFMAVGATARLATGRRIGSPVRLSRDGLTVSLGRSQRVTVTLYDLRGARHATGLERVLPRGVHTIPWRRIAADAHSLAVASVTIAGRSYRLRLSPFGGSASGTVREAPAAAGVLPLHKARASEPMEIRRRDSIEATVDVPIDQGEITIIIDLLPYEILEIAVPEEGRNAEEVGMDREEYPFVLAEYYNGRGGWCSEFVSWAYLAAGYPFTGGYEGGWMLGGSVSIREWFRENARFATRSNSDWQTFVPSPGDYIRYDNEYGGHSGIVRYVSGDDLYTVEGNVNDRVMLRRIRDWRGRSDIDGFGMRSGVAEEKCVVVRAAGS